MHRHLDKTPEGQNRTAPNRHRQMPQITCSETAREGYQGRQSAFHHSKFLSHFLLCVHSAMLAPNPQDLHARALRTFSRAYGWPVVHRQRTRHGIHQAPLNRMSALRP
jgi:hypothetical protein